MATVEPEELKKKTKMVAYDTLSEILQIGPNHTNLFCPERAENSGWVILFRISALEMLILGADELQIRPNGESALEMLMLGAVELQIRPNGVVILIRERGIRHS